MGIQCEDYFGFLWSIKKQSETVLVFFWEGFPRNEEKTNMIESNVDIYSYLCVSEFVFVCVLSIKFISDKNKIQQHRRLIDCQRKPNE